MVGNITFGMIKPNGLESNQFTEILDMINKSGFKIIGLKMVHLSESNARLFYKEHDGKDFFQELVDYIKRGPIVVYVLQKENAVEDYRNLMGSTDPKTARRGTIRYLYGESKAINTVHGSDSDISAERETAFFFSDLELM